MVNTRSIARLGTLAVGLGIGAAWAHTPVASADTSSDWLSSIDGLLSGALPAPATSTLDLAISFNGTSLFSEGTATADSGTAGDYDLAIAYGLGSTADADGGTGDTAIAIGGSTIGSAANASGTGDYALADGNDAFANAGGGTGANYDSAIDIGNNDLPSTGYYDGAYAGDADLIGNTDPNGGTGAHDTAIEIGNDTNSATVGGNEGAFSGAGGLIGSSGDGNGDTAIDVGNEEGADNGPAAVAGNSDYASDSGNESGQGFGALAGFGNGDIATVDGGTSAAQAGGEYTPGDATGPLGNYDVATVYDPSGTVGSFADAGASPTTGGDYDFAGAFADDYNALAQGADYLFTVLPSI